MIQGKMKKFFKEIILILKQFIFIIKSLVSSPKIYSDILKNYKGYGLKFSSLVVLLITIIFLFGFSINLEIFEKNLYSKHSKESTNLDYIINQIPEINYNGDSISLDVKQPLFIKNPKDFTIAAFDLNGNIKISEKKNIPMIFQKNEVIFPNMNYIQSIKYSMFDREKKIITHTDIKNLIINKIESLKNNFVILAIILYFVTFLDYLIQNILIITLSYFTCKFMKLRFSFEDIVRSVLFASAPSAILSTILIFTFPLLLGISSFIKLFCIYFLSRAISKEYRLSR